MPRDGSFNYAVPPGTDGIPDTTIESTKYNNFVHDVETDLNTPRPVVAGGTGASSASGARTNLAAEVRNVQVTNYDSHVWEAGSFWSDAAATGGPVTSVGFGGTCIIVSASDIILIAVQQLTKTQWVRIRTSGSWTAWTRTEAAAASPVTITGTPDSQLILNHTATAGANGYNYILGQRNGLNRWSIILGDVGIEGGSNVGSDFQIGRANDAGVQIDTAISIRRDNGQINFHTGGSEWLRGGPASTTGRAGAFQAMFTCLGNALSFKGNATSGGITMVDFADSALTQCGAINADQGAHTTSYLTSSDERGKQNRAKISAPEARAVIDQLEVYDFDKDGNQIRGYGVIAQQAYEVHPSLAVKPENEDDWWLVEKAAPVPFLIAALQGANQHIDKLEERLAKLEVMLEQKLKQ